MRLLGKHINQIHNRLEKIRANCRAHSTFDIISPIITNIQNDAVLSICAQHLKAFIVQASNLHYAAISNFLTNNLELKTNESGVTVAIVTNVIDQISIHYRITKRNSVGQITVNSIMSHPNTRLMVFVRDEWGQIQSIRGANHEGLALYPSGKIKFYSTVINTNEYGFFWDENGTIRR